MNYVCKHKITKLLFLIILLFSFSNLVLAQNRQTPDNDLFAGSFSTIYPFGEEKIFSNFSETSEFLNNPKNSYVKPSKDEFETDAEFEIRAMAFENKFVNLHGNDKYFSIEFVPKLGEYLHILRGFPLDIPIFDYRFKGTRIYRSSNRARTYSIKGGNILLNDYWTVDLNNSLSITAHTGHISSNVKLYNDIIRFIVNVPDIDIAKNLRHNKGKLLAKIECRLVETKQEHITISGAIPNRLHEGLGTKRYIAHFENIGLHEVEIISFCVYLGDDKHEVVFVEIAERNAHQK